jgi:hypothetical protein
MDRMDLQSQPDSVAAIRPRALSALRNGRRRAVRTICGEALAHALPQERLEIAAALAATGLPEASADLACHLARLGPAGLRLVDRQRRTIPAAFDLLLARGQRAPALRLLAVIRAAADPGLLRGLVQRLGDADAIVAAAAGETILAVTSTLLGPHGRWRAAPGAMAALDAALARAAQTHRTHRSAPALMAVALAAAGRGPRLAAALADADQPIVVALQALADRHDLPVVRDNLIHWLGTRVFARPVARRLAAAARAGALDVALEHGHLLAAPSRRGALRQVLRPSRCLPPAGSVLPPASQSGLVRWIASLPLPEAQRRHLLVQMSRVDAPAARMLALVELRDRCRAVDAESMLPFAQDAHQAIVRLAAAAVLPRGAAAPDPVLLRALERHPQAAVRRRAVSALARIDQDALAEHWDEIDSALRAAALAQMAARDRPSLLAMLRGWLGHPIAARRVAALMVARRMGCVEELRPAILAEVKDEDPRACAAALAALVGVLRRSRGEPDGEVQAALDAGLDHADARVRANAIEALWCWEGGGRSGRLPQFSGEHEEPRPRANAVAAISMRDAARGASRLRAMLRDARSAHRLSAVWAARRLRAAPLLGDVRGMARDDPSAVVRASAATVARVLESCRSDAPAGGGPR